VHILTNMQRPPAEGNILDKNRKAQKPVIHEDYSWYMSYIDEVERRANSYSISRRTEKWTKNYFFTS